MCSEKEAEVFLIQQKQYCVRLVVIINKNKCHFVDF